MAGHPRIRRIAKWTGLVVCVLIVVAWVVSLWVWAGYTADTWAVDVSGGRVRVTIAEGISGSGWMRERLAIHTLDRETPSKLV